MPPNPNLEYQVEELRTTVRELQAQSAGKDAELRRLRELAEATQELAAGDAQTAKIIDLSKKNRQLVLSLEKEKQRTAELLAAMQAAPSSAQPAGPAQQSDPNGVEERAKALVERAVAAAEAANKDALTWKERHNQQTNKIAQLEQKAFALEIENKKVVRALVREVGEEVPLSKILDEASDWKGRREQLIALRDQVKALKAAQGLASEGRQEAAAKKVINKISGQRSAEMDRLAAECGAVRAELEALKPKYEAAVSRRKVLEAEMGSLKEKVAVVLEKSANDSRLIAALRAEVVAAEQRGSMKSAPTVVVDTLKIKEDDLWAELGQLRRTAAQQEEQISRQEQIILSLSAQQPAAEPQQSSLGQQLRLVEVENARLQELVDALQDQLAAHGVEGEDSLDGDDGTGIDH